MMAASLIKKTPRPSYEKKHRLLAFLFREFYLLLAILSMIIPTLAKYENHIPAGSGTADIHLLVSSHSS